jgi:hypothetical protein
MVKVAARLPWHVRTVSVALIGLGIIDLVPRIGSLLVDKAERRSIDLAWWIGAITSIT